MATMATTSSKGISLRRFLSEDMEDFSINLFLRTIGVKDENRLLYDDSLHTDLSHYIARKFQKLGYCVLWCLDLNDTKSDLSKLLKKYHINPQYQNGFSIIVTPAAIKVSEKTSVDPHTVYKCEDPKNIKKYMETPTYKNVYIK